MESLLPVAAANRARASTVTFASVMSLRTWEMLVFILVASLRTLRLFSFAMRRTVWPIRISAVARSNSLLNFGSFNSSFRNSEKLEPRWGLCFFMLSSLAHVVGEPSESDLDLRPRGLLGLLHEGGEHDRLVVVNSVKNPVSAGTNLVEILVAHELSPMGHIESSCHPKGIQTSFDPRPFLRGQGPDVILYGFITSRRLKEADLK